MKVLKFGGTTLKNIDDIKNVANIICSSLKHNNRIIVVISAFFGITDKLLELYKITKKNKNYSYKLIEIKEFHLKIAQQLSLNDNAMTQIHSLLKDLECSLLKISKKTNKTSNKLQDTILSFGERLSSLIISSYLTTKRKDVIQIFPNKFIKTDNSFGCANVDIKKSTNLIRTYIKNTRSKIIICAGFFGSNNMGQITTLGRNGSDYSASLIASMTNADVLEIWKDSNGLYTADPKIVKDAKFIKQLTYQEMQELSSCGNKVLHVNAIAPCISKNIPIILKNCYNPSHKGTIISNKKNSKNYTINCINKINNISLISICFDDFEKLNKISNKIQNMLKNYNDLIITFLQNIRQKNILLLMHNNTASEQLLLDLKSYIKQNNNCNLDIDQEKAMITIIFSKAKSTNVNIFLNKALDTLNKKNIDTFILTDLSGTRISFLCKEKEASKAINLLHSSIFSI